MHLDKVMQYAGNFLPAFVQGLAGFAQIVATFRERLLQIWTSFWQICTCLNRKSNTDL